MYKVVCCFNCISIIKSNEVIVSYRIQDTRKYLRIMSWIDSRPGFYVLDIHDNQKDI